MKVDYTVSFLSLIIHVFNLTSNSGCNSDGVVKEVWWTVLCIKFVCFLKVAARGFLKRMDMQK